MYIVLYLYTFRVTQTIFIVLTGDYLKWQRRMDLALVEVDSVVVIITRLVEGVVEVREAGVVTEGGTISIEEEEALEVDLTIAKINIPMPKIMQLIKTGKLLILHFAKILLIISSIIISPILFYDSTVLLRNLPSQAADWQTKLTALFKDCGPIEKVCYLY